MNKKSDEYHAGYKDGSKDAYGKGYKEGYRRGWDKLDDLVLREPKYKWHSWGYCGKCGMGSCKHLDTTVPKE